MFNSFFEINKDFPDFPDIKGFSRYLLEESSFLMSFENLGVTSYSKVNFIFYLFSMKILVLANGQTHCLTVKQCLL